ncbi:replicative DNA helicase [Thiomicrospira sp. ALE5]|uniref:replicative DNA helicase n=1 Tax=Thiomicrospira sp. ALE5 TaxID=748650 RepID=UPI0008ED2CB2|nr:replicative DNA helicase [Thiomicrospira sp. ALE5]SFR49886.1 replicative DNA helicase [Thiomicrospira sp. ALE5]
MNPTSSNELFKLPPYSEEAEQSVLGALMLSKDIFDDIFGLINEQDFYTKQHQLIYNAIYSLAQRNSAVDLVTLISHLESQNLLDEVGGRDYLADLATNTPGPSNAVFYARIVRDKSILRQLIAASNDIASSCYNSQGATTRDILDSAEAKILAIAEHGSGKQRQYMTIDDLLGSAMIRLDEIFNTEGNITGIATHLTAFDDMTSGLQRGDLIIVAGRPSMGKTTFSMNVAENVATKTKEPVAVFSLEMPGEQLALRMLSSIGRIDSKKMRTGDLKPEDWSNLNSAVTRLSSSQIFIDDTPALSINELRARARRIDKDIREQQRKDAAAAGIAEDEAKINGLSLIVIDYLQLMRGSTQTDNRVNEISEISRGLKALAKELNIPVIALSQLNRSLEQRPNKRPVMSDLRESGAIEQDADLIIFIYRDEVYNPDSEDKGTAEIIIGKHRNGSIGTLRLTFIGQYTRFENFVNLHDQDNHF